MTDLDDVREDGQGQADEDPFDAGTAETSDQDPLADETPAASEDSADEEPTGEFLTEADKMFLLQDPERGFEHVEARVNEFVKKAQKSYTKKMQKAAKSQKESAPIVAAYQTLNQKLEEIKGSGPTGEEYVNRLLRLLKGEENLGGTPKSTPKHPEPKNVSELRSQLMADVRDVIKSELGGLKGDYQQDKATTEVDNLVRKMNNPKLTAIRDKLVQARTQHPDLPLKNVVAMADPDLYADLLSKSRRSKLPDGGSRTEGERSPMPSRKYATADEAMDAAYDEVKRRGAKKDYAS